MTPARGDAPRRGNTPHTQLLLALGKSCALRRSAKRQGLHNAEQPRFPLARAVHLRSAGQCHF